MNKTVSTDIVLSQSAVVLDEYVACAPNATCVENASVVTLLAMLVGAAALGWFARAVIGRGLFSLTDL